MDETQEQASVVILGGGLEVNVKLPPTEEPGHYELGSGEYLIGRHEGCAIVVHSTAISRAHARIAVQDFRYVIADLQSRNGTAVSGVRLNPHQPYPLRDGDVISVAGHELLRFVGQEGTSRDPRYDLVWDDVQHCFRLRGQILELSSSQERLLKHLYDYYDVLCLTRTCAHAAFGKYTGPEDHPRLRSLVFELRERLRNIDGSLDWDKVIRTYHGKGYRLSF